MWLQAYWVLHSPTPFTKYLTKLSFSLLYAAIAYLMVFLVPTSAGSGIPETKASQLGRADIEDLRIR